MEYVKYVAIIIATITLFVLGPFVVIWSLNTLFTSLLIPYNMQTWFAAFVLSGAFGSIIRGSTSSIK